MPCWQRQHGGHRQRALDVAEHHHVLPAPRHARRRPGAARRSSRRPRRRGPTCSAIDGQHDRPGFLQQQVRAQLHADQQEQPDVDDERRNLPEPLQRQHARRLEPGAHLVTDQHAGDDHGDHRRAAELFGQERGGEDRDERGQHRASGRPARAAARWRRACRKRPEQARRRRWRRPACGRSRRDRQSPAPPPWPSTLTSTSAVPSLNRLSPSMIAASRCGTRTLRKASSTLTVSVIASTAPSSSAIGERQADLPGGDRGGGQQRQRHAGHGQRQDRPRRLPHAGVVGRQRALEHQDRQEDQQHDDGVHRRLGQDVHQHEQQADHDQRDVVRHVDALGDDRDRRADGQRRAAVAPDIHACRHAEYIGPMRAGGRSRGALSATRSYARRSCRV